MSARQKSYRERANSDKAKTQAGYQPPPMEKLKYKIIDKRFHCAYLYRLKRNFNKKLREFKKLDEFETRFRIIPN
jgi:hypothetical protein